MICKPKSMRLVTASIFAALVLGACTKPMSELDSYVDGVKRRPPPRLEDIPAIKTFPVFVYQPELLRDPFNTGDGSTEEEVVDRTAEDPDCPDLTRLKEQLEGFALDSLDMVGTMSQGGYFGLIKDPDGTVHRVKVGDFIGQNYGQIISVSEDKIEMEERVKDGIGGCERRNQSIALEDNN